jgi:hypothetical protein
MSDELWSDLDRETQPKRRRVSAYDETYKRAKMGSHHWVRAEAWYEDYVSARYRPALVLPARPGFATCDGGVIVLPGRLSAPALTVLAGDGVREAQIARLEAQYPRLPWLQRRFSRPTDQDVARLVELANRLLDGINRQRQRCAAVLGTPPALLPPLAMYVAHKCTRIGVPHLYSREFVHSSGKLKRPPSDAELAAHPDPAVRAKWARKAWGTAAHGGRLELLLLEGDDPVLMRAYRARQPQPPDPLRDPVVGDFPVERRFSFPYAGFRDFAVAAWEKVRSRRSNHPTRTFKDAQDWVREKAGTAASYPTEPAAQQEAWAQWEWRRHGAPGGDWRQVIDRKRWRYPTLRIMDSLPQLAHCLERVVEQNAVFVRTHELERYASCAATLGLVHHSRAVQQCFLTSR